MFALYKPNSWVYGYGVNGKLNSSKSMKTFDTIADAFIFLDSRPDDAQIVIPGHGAKDTEEAAAVRFITGENNHRFVGTWTKKELIAKLSA